MAVLLDSNILLDLFTRDKRWFAWSEKQLEIISETQDLVINPIIYAEISYRFERVEDLNLVLYEAGIKRETLPFDAAFLAAKCHMRYRKQGGAKTTTLPDFFIGAHAAIAGHTLLTRDKARYKTYFPKLHIVSP